MGIYKNVVTEFIERSLKLVDQYENIKECYNFDEQYNHTLLINCLLGIIVLPDEKVILHVSNERIEIMKKNCNLKNTTFDDSIRTIRELIRELRNAVAHFDIEFESLNESGLIDIIKFKNKEKNIIIATFQYNELLFFVKYYGKLLIDQLDNYYKNISNI